MNNKPAGTQRTFRPEIEGLRAIAAMLVAVFHIWLGRVSGGVDVFFVVSAFLLTTGLLGEVERTGSVQLAAFWGRLVKRLLPAALLVLCAVIVASVVLMPKSRWKGVIEEVAASALYAENWVLAAKSVDYLAQHSAVSPVQHFWALSTQGQFYFVLPLLFAAVALLAQRTKLAFRSALTWTFCCLFALSLAFSVYITLKNQPLAYFNTFARAWEFCIGMLLAIVLSKVQLPSRARFVAGWIGLIAILSCGLVFQVSRMFPGYAALWPTLGAALVILAGTSGNPLGADRILASRPLVYLGGISYGIYLWHFPLLVFYRMYIDPMPVSFAAGVAIVAAALVLAHLTNRFVENPARHSSIGKEIPVRALAFGATCLVPVALGIAAWTFAYLHVRDSELKQVAHDDPSYPGARALEQGFQYRGRPDVPMFPGPLRVLIDRESRTGEGCGGAFKATGCLVAGTEGMPIIAVVGGSHSSHWQPALHEIATAEGWRVLSWTRDNCPFHVGEATVSEHESKFCRRWNEKVFKRLVQIRPAAVFMTATRYSAEQKQDDHEFVPRAYVHTWQALAAEGINVIAIRDNPDFNVDVMACVEIHGATSPRCSRPRARMIAHPSPIELLQPQPPNVKFVDLSDHFCSATTCAPVIGNVMVYRHGSHITGTYVRSLAPMLRRAIMDDARVKQFSATQRERS